MNIKLLSSLGLLAPEPLASGTGAGIESPGGATPGASPAEENFYSKADSNGGGDAGGAEGADGKPDFTAPDAAKPQGDQPAGDEPVVGDDGQPVAPKVEAKAPTLKLDAETIAELRKGLAPQAPTPEAQKPTLSPEKLKEMLSPVEVTDDVVAGLRDENPEVVKATMQNFANATVKNAVAIARIMIQQAEKRAEAVLGPLHQQHVQQQQEAVKTSFFAQHPSLVKYGKLVTMAAQEISADPASANFTPEQSFKAVADRVQATLKELGVTITPANPGAGGESNKVPAPNKLSPSGRSGGDTNGQRGKGNDADADIYKR